MQTPQTPVPGRNPERRRAPRYPFDTGLDIEWGSATLSGRVHDISAGGMFIEVADSLWVHARFSARLVLDVPVRLDCVVRRVELGRGMGVSYIVPGEDGRARLTSLLGTLAKK